MMKFNFADVYEMNLVAPLFEPFARATLERVTPVPGESLLDIACGTGIVARLARPLVGPGARVVGVDLSPDMIAVAGRIEPSVEWRQGDAAALPLEPGETFDVVVCQQGLQFVADRSAAAQCLARAVAPGGRVAVSTWQSLDHTPLFRELHQVAERHLGPMTDRRHGFGDADALERLLRESGFGEVDVTTVTRTVRFTDGATFLRMNAMAQIGMSGVAKDASEEERGRLAGAIAADCVPVAAAWMDGAGLAFDLGTNLAVGRP